MGGCRCSYKTCKSATKSIENLHFFHYPVKHRERCDMWIKNAEKPEFIHLPDDQLRNKVICGLHFEDKYFTNVQKKRLVHDAIPTLNAGCEEVSFTKEVEVFPTSVDGTTFTLQAEHMQPGTSRNSEQKIGFRNGKMIVHNFESTESEVYTIDPSYIHQSFYNPDQCKDVFINSSNYQSDSNESITAEAIPSKDVENAMIFESSEEQLYRNMLEEENLDYTIEDQEDKNVDPLLFVENECVTTEQIPFIKKDYKPEKHPKLKKCVNKTVLKRINIHAQEIANIKRSLAQNTVKLPKKGIIRMLKGRVPDTLLGALSLHLNKRQNNLSCEEKAFLNAMYSISPSAYKALQDFGWYIPKHIVIDRSITISDQS